MPKTIASFSKGLPHNALGEVDAPAYSALRAALPSGASEDFEKIPVAGQLKVVNPQAGLAFSLEGLDAHTPAIAPAPAFDSAEQAWEACELYWQAVARDVPFVEYGHRRLRPEEFGARIHVTTSPACDARPAYRRAQ